MLATYVVALVCYGTALTHTAAAGENAHRSPKRAVAHGRADFLAPGATVANPYYGIGIDIAPGVEHWRGNYRPDGYRLRGYDAHDSGKHFCRGRRGRTVSSAGIDCPPGQKSESGTRRYSTDGNRP